MITAVLNSIDGGVTWNTLTADVNTLGEYFGPIAASSDGSKVFAIDMSQGDIWTAALSPTLTTSAASSIISGTSATLNGSITTLGAANSTTEGFVYGSITSYGATTTSSGSFGVGAFNVPISSLTCNTTYHFAAYATNVYATSYGNDQSFTTGPCPSNGAPVGLIGGGGGGGSSVAVAIPENGSEAMRTNTSTALAAATSTTTASTPARISTTTAQLVSLYTALLQLLQQELSLLMTMRGT